jgi:predicted flap endonuclease-1-like 5' DNA nuclease
MRLDITLYSLAVVFFVITIASAVLLAGTDQTLWILTSGLLGILSLSLGFIQRPRTTAQINQPPTAIPVTASAQPIGTATPQAPTEEERLPAQTASVTETPAVQEPAVTVEQPAIPEPSANIVSSQEAIESSMGHALTEVSGIGEKRATQLNALGIFNVDDLAKAQAEDLAKSLKVSPKIVAKWVMGAKQLLQK